MGKMIAAGVIVLSFIYICVYTAAHRIRKAAHGKRAGMAEDFRYIL